VIQIAVTATAHFDEEKSVEKTHERLIYGKRLNAAIRGGEGAAYIQAQPATIRIQPDEHMLSNEFNEASQDERANYRRHLIEIAYNEAVLEVYRDGTDKHTGDLLSDNQAAFFCRRTKQADNLAEMLNSDPVLKAKAKELGYKGVAIAIHTGGLSSKEQTDRFEAVQDRNEYMSIVGDSKFKEGFDHPSIKNIFDMPRKSLVDKEQIIGRGGRKWFNEAKNRYEGLTVFDPIIYIGSDDSEADKRLRKKALKQATSVKSILEDTCVLGPQAKGYQAILSPKKANFFEVENSTVAIKKLKKDTFQLCIVDQYGRVKVYEDLDKDLIAELNTLFANPQLLDKQSYQQKIVKDIRLSVGHLAPPSEKPPRPKPFEGNPNVTHYTDFGDIYRLEQEKATIRRDDCFEITDEMRAELTAEMERTRIGPVGLIKNAPNPPTELKEGVIQSWKSGLTSTANPDHWSWVARAPYG
jgi:hypothetical protein